VFVVFFALFLCVKRVFAVLAAAVAAAALNRVLKRARARLELRRGAETTDPSIPPSESSARRLRDKPGFAQEDADQEPA
jgi:hypothetical protein